jgi:hypothetical protein
MTRSEEFDRGNVVLSTQRRKLWRTLSGQAHTYRTGNKVGVKGEVVIGCSFVVMVVRCCSARLLWSRHQVSTISLSLRLIANT